MFDQPERQDLSTQELQMLLLMGQAMTQEQDEEDICRWINDAASPLLGATLVSLILTNPKQTDPWAVCSGLCVDGREVGDPLHYDSLAGRLAELSEMKWSAIQKVGGIAILRKDDLPPALIQRGVHSLVRVPVRAIHREFGLLIIGRQEPWALDTREHFILTTLANQAAVALENVRLRHEISQHAERLASFNRMIRAITSALDLQGVFRMLSSEAQQLIVHDRASVALADPDAELVRVYAATGNGAKLAAGATIPMAGSLVGQVIRSGEGRFTTDLEQETEFREVPDVLALGIRSNVMAPLWHGDECFGSLNFGSTEAGKYGPDELALAQEIADQIAVAIVNVRLHEQARKVAALEERQRLARNLHDSAAQALYGIVMYAEAARQLAGDGHVATDYFGEIRDTAQEALRDMRLLIFDLRPPVLEEEGLAGALKARLEAVEGRAGIETRFQVEGKLEVPAQVEEGLYHIAQETLNNVLKHAAASQITVRLHQTETTATLEVVDDGVGFEPEAAHQTGGLGLSGMAERTEELGGTLEIDSAPGAGTKVTVKVPVTNRSG